MPTYKTLKRTHVEYDADLFEQLEDLYEGGFLMIKKAAKYLPPLLDEHTLRHAERCRAASYMPYLGQVIDQLCAWLFEDVLVVLPAPDAEDPETPGELPDKDFYSTFTTDADLGGTNFSDVVRSIVGPALLKGRSLIGVDFPSVGEAERARILTVADEAERGTARAYLYSVPVEQLLNWEKNSDGTFRWAVVWTQTDPQEGPLGESGQRVEEFRIWEIDQTGKATWRLYRIEYDRLKPPPVETDVPEVAAGQTDFQWIPLIELRMPKGLWVGNKIGPQVREHFQRRSTLIANEYRTMCEVAVYKQGPEIGAPGASLPSEIQENPGRGRAARRDMLDKGYVVIGSDDELLFAGPTGAAHEVVSRELMELKDEIFRVVHLMAASVSMNRGQAVARSGLAKQQDRADTAIVLGAIGSHVRRFAHRIYNTISRARGEDVVWVVSGLDEYQTKEREVLIEEAVSIDAVDIPSPTWKAAYKTEIAFELKRDLPPETQAQIREEIREGVAHEEDMKSAMDDAQMDSLENPQLGMPAPSPHSAPVKPRIRPPIKAPATTPRPKISKN